MLNYVIIVNVVLFFILVKDLMVSEQLIVLLIEDLKPKLVRELFIYYLLVLLDFIVIQEKDLNLINKKIVQDVLMNVYLFDHNFLVYEDLKNFFSVLN